MALRTLSLVLGALGAAVAFGSAGCGDRPFLRADPPVASGGVSVALTGQRCRRRVRQDQNGILDLVLALRVTNAGSAPLAIAPARLVLHARGDTSQPDDADAPVELAPGGAASVRVHFRAWNNARCNEPLSVSFDGAVSPPILRPLAFTPEASDV
jgi:hypothetical protein